MTETPPFESIIQDIEKARKEFSLPPGWRFLYTPQSTFYRNNGLLILGLNPGGDPYQPSIPTNETGNAYLNEVWRSKLQPKLTVLLSEVAHRLNINYEDMMNFSCTSNFVPFRSRTWKDLEENPDILKFSYYIWMKALVHVAPKVIICVGKIPLKGMIDLYSMDCRFFQVETKSVKRQTVSLFLIDEVAIIGIPHLAHWAAFCDAPELIELVTKGMKNLPAVAVQVDSSVSSLFK